MISKMARESRSCCAVMMRSSLIDASITSLRIGQDFVIKRSVLVVANSDTNARKRVNATILSSP